MIDRRSAAGSRPAPFDMVSAGAWPDRLTFSPAVRAGNLLFISGTTATDDRGTIVSPGDIVGQTRHIYGKFAKLLAAAGASLGDIVSTTEYVTTTAGYKGTAEVRRELFGGPPYPTATGVIVAGLLRPGALIEISAIAIIPAAHAGSSPSARGSVWPTEPRAPEAP
jgi:enamine deaminase RidA (YjgF/YER057c/UK114 family)